MNFEKRHQRNQEKKTARRLKKRRGLLAQDKGNPYKGKAHKRRIA